MNIESVRLYCLGRKGAIECFPFDDETLVFKVMGKMFACIFLGEPDKLVLKCEPEYAIELRERYAAIEPAWHFNKRHWNQHWLSRLDDELIRNLIDHSYAEVVKKMTRKMREELINME